MLPVARTERYELRGECRQYLWRVRGASPPYYYVALLVLLMIWLIPTVRSGHDPAWHNKVPATLERVISHGFLVHVWNSDWINQIDGPA